MSKGQVNIRGGKRDVECGRRANAGAGCSRIGWRSCLLRERLSMDRRCRLIWRRGYERGQKR